MHCVKQIAQSWFYFLGAVHSNAYSIITKNIILQHEHKKEKVWGEPAEESMVKRQGDGEMNIICMDENRITKLIRIIKQKGG